MPEFLTIIDLEFTLPRATEQNAEFLKWRN